MERGCRLGFADWRGPGGVKIRESYQRAVSLASPSELVTPRNHPPAHRLRPRNRPHTWHRSRMHVALTPQLPLLIRHSLRITSANGGGHLRNRALSNRVHIPPVADSPENGRL